MIAIPEGLVFLDVETTGLDANRERIIEIFLLSLGKQGEVAQYETLLNPQRPLPAAITELTGLRDADLRNAPVERQVAGEIREFLGFRTPVAHNLPFDRRFLNALFRRNGLSELGAGGLDTLAISRELFPKLCIYPGGGGSHRLSNLMYHFGLEDAYANAHRAKDDVLLLVEVFRGLQRYSAQPASTNGFGATNAFFRDGYPPEAIMGCPRCGSPLYLERLDDQIVLTCKKRADCAMRLVI